MDSSYIEVICLSCRQHADGVGLPLAGVRGDGFGSGAGMPWSLRTLADDHLRASYRHVLCARRVATLRHRLYRYVLSSISTRQWVPHLRTDRGPGAYRHIEPGDGVLCVYIYELPGVGVRVSANNTTGVCIFKLPVGQGRGLYRHIHPQSASMTVYIYALQCEPTLIR